MTNTNINYKDITKSLFIKNLREYNEVKINNISSVADFIVYNYCKTLESNSFFAKFGNVTLGVCAIFAKRIRRIILGYSQLTLIDEVDFVVEREEDSLKFKKIINSGHARIR